MNQLEKYRKRLGYSLRRTADVVRAEWGVAINFASISQWERGRGEPDPDYVCWLVGRVDRTYRRIQSMPEDVLAHKIRERVEV